MVLAKGDPNFCETQHDNNLEVSINNILKAKQDLKNKFMSVFTLFYLIYCLDEKYDQIKEKYLFNMIYKILKILIIVYHDYNAFNIEFFSYMTKTFFRFSSISDSSKRIYQKILLLIDNLNTNFDDKNGKEIFSLKQNILKKIEKIHG